MRKDLVLIFAYHFPPENMIGAVRPFRLYKYLRRLGAECHVITAADVSARPDLDAQYLPDPFETSPGEGFGWHVQRAMRKFLFPGATGTQWAGRACRAAANFIAMRKDARVTVFSTYPPMGTHLAAFCLTRRTTLPWIADFRDPLADSPGNGDLNWVQREAYRRMERLFVNRAACIIANTDTLQDRLKRTYPRRAERVHLLSNGFDPEQRVHPLPLPDRAKRVFSHVGELYEGRNVAPLLLSIGRLVNSGRIPGSEIQIQLVGPGRRALLGDSAFIDAATAQGWLKLDLRPVPQSEAQLISQTSDGLLLVQPHSTLQVPGKLFEYIQIGRPILAFILPDSPAERILERSGIVYQCAYASASPEALDESVFRFFKLNTVSNKPSAWFEAEFNTQNHAQKLFELIQKMNGER